MPGKDPENQLSNPAQMIAAWLEQVLLSSTPGPGAEPGNLPIFPQWTAWERLSMLRTVLDRRPTLAASTRRLSVYEQFRLTVEFLGNTGAADNRSQDRLVARTPDNRAATRPVVPACPAPPTCTTQPPGRKRWRMSRTGRGNS